MANSSTLQLTFKDITSLKSLFLKAVCCTVVVQNSNLQEKTTSTVDEDNKLV